ncbi:MAG: extracellular solute-binding protein [Chloroflexi bacterium]|nr:MAG: extracellular solute-binding protein [Chloroflexota bacterium]
MISRPSGVNRRQFLSIFSSTVAAIGVAACAAPAPAQPTAAPPPAAPAAKPTTAPAAPPTTAPAAAATSAPAAAAATTAPAVAQKGTLTFSWFDWLPARLLNDLGKDYVKVGGWSIQGDLVGATQWHDKIFTEFAAKGGADFPILDSQWIGEGVAGGHIVEITDYAQKNINLKDINPPSLTSYGEFPQGSGKLYGLPCEQDALAYVVRKDLFQDAKEQQAFKAKYNRDLAPARNWDEYYDIAEFFNRPEQGLYGTAMHFAAAYDAITCNFNQILWSWGGELWDGKAKTDGFINSEAGVGALQWMQKLYRVSPPGSGNWWFDEVNNAMAQGQVAQAINWFAFHAGLVDPKASKVADKIIWGVVPAGPKAHVAHLGGMGIHISSYSKNKDAALDFVKWFQTQEVQKKWAQAGALTANVTILNSPEFVSYEPWNQTFKETLPLLRDFWNLPEYARMLDLQEKTLNAAVVNQTDAREALDKIAKGQQSILEDAGYA